MTKLLKKGHQGIIAQLCSLDVQTSKPSIPQDVELQIYHVNQHLIVNPGR
jgi:hypothetical protein